MKKRSFLCLLVFPFLLSCGQQESKVDSMSGKEKQTKETAVNGTETKTKDGGGCLLATPDGLPAREVALDSMDMKNPFVMYEPATNLYYMTGDGGLMWTSVDLKLWRGPYDILDLPSNAWTGSSPSVFSPEIYRRDNRYYLVASFGYKSSGEDKYACSVLASDKIIGPYKLLNESQPLIDVAENAVWPAYADDGMGNTCIIYAEGDAESANIKIQMLTGNQDGCLGEPFGMLDVSKLPWKSGVLESPEYFMTAEGGFGMLFASTFDGKSVVAVAYSQKELGHPINGPWIVEDKPFVEGNVGGASTFVDYDGTDVLVMHKEITVNGIKRYVPQFLKLDTQFEKLVEKGNYIF